MIKERRKPVDKHTLKEMSYRELDQLADDMRSELITTMAATGGHFASNLGTVELTIALERVFDTPTDKVIWDVGHQVYAHKMLTGRWEQMKTLRSLGGLSGFPKREESPHDFYDAGHCGTSISAALGFAKARDLAGEDHACVAVIGDGSMTAGVAYEALNMAGTFKTPLIVVLNDNAMSISKNVGGLSRHLQDLRLSRPYLRLKASVKKKLRPLPGLRQGLASIRDWFKYILTGSTIFEKLGFKYYGPIDGHDIKRLVETLTAARSMDRPVLVHAVTVKGKGYPPAERQPDLYHGTGPFDLDSGLQPGRGGQFTDLFSQELARLAQEDPSIVAITAAMLDGTGLANLQERFADRVIDAGIAEQHAVSMAAGLALAGMRPVVAMYSTFLQRAYDQVLTEVCLQQAPVLFAVDRAGISGQDGETHQGQFDLQFLSSMPGLCILAPRDGRELKAMMRYALTLDGPCAIRFPKGAAEGGDEGERPFDGRMDCLLEGEDLAFVCVGTMCQAALWAARALRDQGRSCALYDLRTVKPLDASDLRRRLSGFKALVTVEDGTAEGGIGMRVCQLLGEEGTCPPSLHLGWPDAFIPHGSIGELHALYGLDGPGILAKTEAFLEDQT